MEALRKVGGEMKRRTYGPWLHHGWEGGHDRDETGGCYFWALTALMGGNGCVASGFLTITVLLYIDTD